MRIEEWHYREKLEHNLPSPTVDLASLPVRLCWICLWLATSAKFHQICIAPKRQEARVTTEKDSSLVVLCVAVTVCMVYGRCCW